MADSNITGSETTGATAAGGREAAVLERIEAFRRRPTRFTDDVVTLAHGAGGKASAALIESVFLDQFAKDSNLVKFQPQSAQPTSPPADHTASPELSARREPAPGAPPQTRQS